MKEMKHPTVRCLLKEGETLSAKISPFAKIFLCEVVGVVLRKRGSIDSHVSFEIISEDDGNWFPYTSAGASSYWLSYYMAVLLAAKQWCDKECRPADSNPDGSYGWVFKKGVKEFDSDDPVWRGEPQPKKKVTRRFNVTVEKKMYATAVIVVDAETAEEAVRAVNKKIDQGKIIEESISWNDPQTEPCSLGTTGDVDAD